MSVTKSRDRNAIQWLATKSLKPHDKALRRNESAVTPVAASIKAYGFNQPIVVDSKLVIVVGMTRWLAAQQLNLKQVPVLVAKHLTPDQARAYRIADNQTATIATFDQDKIVQEILALSETQIDLTTLGFDTAHLEQMLAAANADGGDGSIGGGADPDEIPGPPAKPVSQLGDLWQIGPHRLLHGNSSLSADVDRLMGGEMADMVLSDPPYNVNVEPRSNNAIAAGLSSFPADKKVKRGHHQAFDQARVGKRKPTHKVLRAKDRPLVNDFLTDAEFATKLDEWFGNFARILVPGGSFYIWGGYANIANYPPALAKHGLKFAQGIVWDKMHPVLTRKDYMGAYELGFYGWREGAAHQFYGPPNGTDLWPIRKINPQQMQHVTEKPVELAERCICNSSPPGARIVDLFGGAGWTLIAAARTRRRAYLCEIDGSYVDTILERVRRHLKIEPKLLSPGEA